MFDTMVKIHLQALHICIFYPQAHRFH